MPENNTTTNSSVVTVTRPQPGTTASIASQRGAAIQFQFDPMLDADIARPDGSNDLRFVYEDGSEVVLSDFFAVGEESLPLLVFPDGTSVDVAQAFAGMDIDLSPAAGPGAGAGAAGSGVGEYSADAGDAIGGIDRLDMTDPFYWGNGEAREELQTLNAETLPGIPGAPGDPEEPDVPDVPEDPVAYLHAHDNVGLLDAETKTVIKEESVKVEDPFAPKGNNLNGWQDAGKYGDHQVPSENGKKTGIMTENKSNEVFEKMGFDVQDFIDNAADAPSGWNLGNGSNELGVIKSPVYTVGTAGEDGSHTIDVAWSMYATQNGGQANQVLDFTAALLFRCNPDGTYTLVDHKFLEFNGMDDKNVPISNSTSASWTVEEGGKYVVVFAVLENGGQKTVLTIDGVEHEYMTDPVLEQQFAITGEGNVIVDVLDPDGDGYHEQGRDHHSDEALNSSIQVTGVTINGVDLQYDPESGLFSSGPEHDFKFTMDADGNYKFEWHGKGEAPSIGDLDIKYQISASDGSTAEANLNLEEGSRTYTGTDLGGTIHGSAGDDTIYGLGGDDIIYGGQGDDILDGGAGSDVFVWGVADYDGGTDSILNFDFNCTWQDGQLQVNQGADNDKIQLDFSALLGEHQDLADVLSGLAAEGDAFVYKTDSGAFAVTFLDDDQLRITLTDSEGAEYQTIMVESGNAFHDNVDAIGQTEAVAILEQILKSV